MPNFEVTTGISLAGLRILFMGTPEFAVAALAALHQAGATVCAVVTPPDRPAGRGLKISQSHVKEYAAKHQLPLLQPENLNDDSFLAKLKEAAPDLGVVVAFRKLPKAVWALPPLGTFNLHASLLPQYRGAAPIQRAVMEGESVSGVTTFLLDDKIDTGATLLHSAVPIAPHDTAGDLHDKLMDVGARLVVQTARGLADATLTATPQPQIPNLHTAPKIFREDCAINWQLSARQIHNHIRGLAPHPGAWCLFVRGTKILEVKLFDSRVAPPSPHPHEQGDTAQLRVSTDRKRLIAPCGGNGECISFGEVQLPGKRRMRVEEFLRGLKEDEILYIKRS